MSEDVFRDVADAALKDGAKREAWFERDRLKTLLESKLPADEVRGLVKELGSEFGLLWFNRSFEFPLILVSRNLHPHEASLMNFWKRYTKSEIWKAYQGFRSEYVDPFVGMAFPVKDVGSCIIHNMLELEPTETQKRIVVHQSIAKNTGCVLHAWEDFCRDIEPRWRV